MAGGTVKYKNFVNKNYHFLFFVLPSAAGILVFLIIPLLDVVKRSFFGGISSNFVGLDNYSAVFANDAFWLAVKNTLLFDAISLPLLLMISLCMAYIVSNMKSKLIRFAFLAPMAIPSNSVVTVWKMLFDDAGIINGIRVMLELEPVSFLTGQIPCIF